MANQKNKINIRNKSGQKPSTGKKDSNRNKIILSLAGILILTIIVFYNAGSYGILNWDDDHYLIDNPHIKDLSASSLKTIFSTFYPYF